MVNSIPELLTAILKAYETYLSTQQESWERKKDKKQIKAIQNADEIVDRIKDMGINDNKLNQLIDKHQKYNN